ncbi:hypothetical protein J3R83DRAFT_13377 [Lanmaoa asiatica]|nr:hypothetical protein J3R83DRAFT_13377 [Lanmaoa asiatica]
MGLMRPALILIAVLAGGDYNEGLRGCSMMIAYGLSKYGLGEALVDAFTTKDRLAFTQFLSDWRGDLQNTLATDPAGFLGCRHVALAHELTDFSPSYEVLQHYVNPLDTFTVTESQAPADHVHHSIESRQPDLGVLARLCEQRFQWAGEVIAMKLRAMVWEGALLQRLCKLQSQAGDEMTFTPALRFIDRSVINTKGLELVVFKVRCDSRVEPTCSSVQMPPPPPGLKKRSHKMNNEETMFVTIPACVIDYAFPDEAAHFMSTSTEQMPTSHAGCRARERVAAQVSLLDVVNGPLPGPSHPPAVSTSASVIDLTVDSGRDSETESGSEVEVIG